MKRYRIKSADGSQAFLELTEEGPDGYTVRIIRYFDGYQTTVVEPMTRELFETCLRTGYIEEMLPTEDGAAIANGMVEAAS